jgi:hypothetical protein
MHPEVVVETQRRVAELGGRIEHDPDTDMMTVNGEFTISIVLARCHQSDEGRRRWKIRFDTGLLPDISVAVRLDASNARALDYYLLPHLDFGIERLSLSEQNGLELESYRFENLEYLYDMARRERLRWAA